MIAFFAKIWLNYLKPFWSRLRWCTHLHDNGLEVPRVLETEIPLMLDDVYNSYTWTADGITELTDSYRPLPYVYNLYVEAEDGGTKFKDDCDGYHSVIYHILAENGFDCALITLVTKPFTKSHTMCVYRYANEDGFISYKVINYRAIKGPYSDLQDFVDAYQYPVRYWNLQKYDYAGRKFYTVDRKDF